MSAWDSFGPALIVVSTVLGFAIGRVSAPGPTLPPQPQADEGTSARPGDFNPNRIPSEDGAFDHGDEPI